MFTIANILPDGSLANFMTSKKEKSKPTDKIGIKSLAKNRQTSILIVLKVYKKKALKMILFCESGLKTNAN